MFVSASTFHLHPHRFIYYYILILSLVFGYVFMTLFSEHLGLFLVFATQLIMTEHGDYIYLLLDVYDYVF